MIARGAAMLSLALVVAPAAYAAASAPASDPHAIERESELERIPEGNDREASAETLFRLAEADEAEGRYPRALARYDAAVACSSSSRYAAPAKTRADVLRSHAEGNFAPFARLEAVRADPKRADDPRELEALARAADAFPPGLVRSEARMVIAEAYLGRLGRPRDAVAVLRQIVSDPNADPLTARKAARALIDALAGAGDLVGAVRVTRDLGPTADPMLIKHMDTLVRRAAVHHGALADLGILALLVGGALVGAARRKELARLRRAVHRSLPPVFAFAGFIGFAGAALAVGYEAGNAQPFLLLGAVLVPLAVLARAWGSAGSTHPAARAARAAFCASGVVAAAFLILESVDVRYLANFGL